MKTLLLLIGLILSSTANAYCYKSYVCHHGLCGYIDVCESTLDLPSTNIDPLPQQNYQIEPLPSLSVPPIGTNQCKYMSVNGQWRNVCY